MEIETVRKKVAELDSAGLTPLDLFSWVYLLDLHARYKTFEGIDLDIHHRMQQDITDALRRKAAMLDVHGKTTFHRDLLTGMGIR